MSVIMSEYGLHWFYNGICCRSQLNSDSFLNFCLFLQTHLQSQRALLIQGTESLNNASKSIERSQRIAVETDQIGTDIIEELGEQREQLDRTRDRVRERYLDQRPLLSLLNKQIINCTSKMSTINSLLLFLCSYPPNVSSLTPSSVGSYWREPEPQQENPACNVQTVRLTLLQNILHHQNCFQISFWNIL